LATGRIGTTPVLTVRWSKAPAAGTTSLSGLDDNSVSLVYSVGYEQVYLNGALLSRGNDYTATNGTTITLTNATVAGDIVEVFANAVVPLTDTYTQSQANGKFINNTLTTTTGDIIYASAANTPARLAIGSTSQVLTVSGGVPTWATPSSGSWTLLYTVTMSSASAITQSTDFTGYRQAVVEYENVTCGNTWNLQTKLNNSTTGLYIQYFSNDSTTVISAQGVSFVQTGSGGAQTTARFDGFLTIDNPASTSAYKAVDYTATYTRNAAGSPIWSMTNKGFFRDASAITSIVFDSNATNFTGGTVRIYGVK
jgi:hypothetical protein